MTLICQSCGMRPGREHDPLCDERRWRVVVTGSRWARLVCLLAGHRWATMFDGDDRACSRCGRWEET